MKPKWWNLDYPPHEDWMLTTRWLDVSGVWRRVITVICPILEAKATVKR